MNTGENKMRCAKCGTDKKLQRHHIFPRRHYGVRGLRIYLCQTHHREIEAIIFQHEGKERKKLERWVYQKMLANYLQEE